MNKQFTAIILLNVLAGLLFSCGEGVRLLPFPSSEITGNLQTELKSDNKIPYQPNIHRFETDQRNFQKKIQRDTPQKLFSDEYQSLNKISLVFSQKHYKIPTLADFKHFSSNLFFESEGSRAPPFMS